ncbi:hypothetical protein K2X89_00180 [Myxococcota bacterium]|nr:hypothetical protein [Myxococcota bacterium]
MLPPDLPFEEDDERRARLERSVTREFEAAAITIAPSVEVEKLLDAVDERSGKIFEPETGRVDDAKQSLFLDDIERSTGQELGCTGFVRIGLHQVLAYYDGHYAHWDGRRTAINSGARIAGRIVLGILAGAYIQERGWVPALSLSIQVTNLRYDDVAFRTAGVEPLVNFSVSRKQDLLPADRWLEDEAQVETAIGLALGSGLAELKGNGRPGATPLPDGFRWN